MAITKYTDEFIHSLLGKTFGLNKIVYIPKKTNGCNTKVTVKCLRCGNLHKVGIMLLCKYKSQQCPNCQNRKYEIQSSPSKTPKLHKTWRKYKKLYFDAWKNDWPSFQKYMLKKYKWNEQEYSYRIERINKKKPFAPDNIRVLQTKLDDHKTAALNQ